jgi:PKD domain-containing protein
MLHNTLRFLVVLVLVAAAACGGDTGSSPSPVGGNTLATVPSTINRPPAITSFELTPAFGIAGLTEFAFSASAVDLDGDSVSYTWNVGDRAFSGPRGRVTIQDGGQTLVRLTVSDVRGATISRTQSLVVGSMSGDWMMTSGPLLGGSLTLAQHEEGVVTGGIDLPGVGRATTDPEDPGRISAAAEFRLRVRLADRDVLIVGTMDATGRVVSGTLAGAGFDGEPFSMRKSIEDDRECHGPKPKFDCR